MDARSVKKYLKAHKIKSRWTTFNGAAQAALAVPERYDSTKHRKALSLLGQELHGSLSCVYCDAEAQTWDHLENNVQSGRYSGYGNRLFNLVPACRTCNERKGAKSWRLFVEENARPGKLERLERLATFAAADEKERFGWDEILIAFPDLAGQYVVALTKLKEILEQADAIASEIRLASERRLVHEENDVH